MDISSPCDLVKELLDNAIDAKATSIEIIMSSNSIDRISVKDNGTGIDIDDFNCLGRRAHTSKIREYSDLINLAGKTLGFRGEALASVNSMASTTIITKKTGDPIAWRIELVPGVGGVRDKRPVSATVGTTVAVTKLFESFPARRQYALKMANKSVPEIQEHLKAYAFARPHIKMSLKIVGDGKPLWSYSPKPPNLKREAMLHIFGANILGKCIEINDNMYLNQASTHTKSTGQVQWAFDGYISKPCHTLKDLKGKRKYVSIDGRPMSSEWHTAKKLSRILKPQISGVTTSTSGERRGGMFMQINVKCLPGSYDPNIATKKDEVLILDEKGLLEKFEAVCKRVLEAYSQAQRLAPQPTTARNHHIATLDHNESKHKNTETQNDGKATPIATGKACDDNGKVDSHGHGPADVSEAAHLMVKTKMKTTFEVNMGHNKKDGSDEEDTDTTIEVEVLPRAAPVRDRHSNNEIHHPRQKESIRRYFQPVQRDDFEIACDDTATAESPEESGRDQQLDESSLSNRAALQPLSEVAMNRIREEAESSPEPPGSDWIAPAAIVNFNREAPMPSLQRPGNGTRLLGTQGLQRTVYPPLPIGPSLREGNNDERSSPSRTLSPPMLTPPPSDPRYRLTHFDPRTILGPHPSSASLLRTSVPQQRYNGLHNEREISLTSGSKQGVLSFDTRGIGFMSGTAVASSYPSQESQSVPRRATMARPTDEQSHTAS